MKKETTIKISKHFRDLLKNNMKKSDGSYEDFIKIRFDDLLKKNAKE